MSITSVKSSLKTLLSGVSGVKSVYTNLPRNQQGMMFPSIVMAFEKTHEHVQTMGNPSRRRIHYVVTLYIQTIDPDPNEQAAQQRFDDLLDAIDTQLRSDKSLGGTVLYSAQDYIDTDVFTPQLAGQGLSVLLRATKTFTVCVEITG